MPKTFWIVWNEARTEGFVTDDESDANCVLTGQLDYSRGYPSITTAGEAFRDTYEDDELSIEQVELPESSAS